MYKLIHYARDKEGNDEFFNVGASAEEKNWTRNELVDLITELLNETAGHIIEISPKRSGYFKVGDAQFCILTKKNNPISEKIAYAIFQDVGMAEMFNLDDF